MAGAVGARRLPPTPVSNPSATAHAMASLAKLLTALPSALASSADRVYLKTENVTGNEEFFALSKTFFRRNTDVFQEKLTQRKKVRCPGTLAVGRIHPKICNNAKPEAVSSVSGLFMLMYVKPDWV